MTELSLKHICNMFFEVANIPLVICRADGEPWYWVPHTDMPDEPSSVNKQLIEKFDAISQDRSIPFVEISVPPFFFAVVKLDGDDYLVVGPVAPVKYGEAEFRELARVRAVPEEKRAGYCERTMRIAVLSFRQFLATVALITQMVNGRLISPDDILLSRPFVTREVEKHLAHAMLSARDNQVMHTPASFEHYVLQAVADGNVPKLKQALLSPVSGSIGKMSDDPLRQEKYTFICFITLITRAAITGGLNQEQSFSLSDIYCQRVDRLQDISEIAKLSWDMCMDFTEKVATVKGKDKLSLGISACCEYINVHLHDDIHLPQLAELARTSVKTLSKKFKQETGLSVVDYIHQERIKEAQSLLEFSDYSISEIGYHLRYGSQSYFSSIFKKISRVTPQQFRERLKQ